MKFRECTHNYFMFAFGSGPDPSGILENAEKEIGSLKKVENSYSGAGKKNGIKKQVIKEGG